MFESPESISIEPDGNDIEKEYEIKYVLKEEHGILSKFNRGKVGKALRVMVAVSAISLGGYGVYKGAESAVGAINEYSEELNEVRHGFGTIVEKNTYKSGSGTVSASPFLSIPVSGEDAWSIKVEMDGKIIEAQVSKSIFENCSKGNSVSFEYQNRGSMGGPEIIINSMETK